VVDHGGVVYLDLWYYAPAGGGERAVYLADPAAELAFDRTDTVDRGYLALGRWTKSGAAVRRLRARQTAVPACDSVEPQWIDARLDRLQAQRTETRARSGRRVVRIVRLARALRKPGARRFPQTDAIITWCE
jgi:hypothetical protein